MVKTIGLYFSLNTNGVHEGCDNAVQRTLSFPS